MATFPDMLMQARRRWLINQALRYAGWGLAFGLLVGLALLAVDRLAGVDVPLLMLVIAAGIGLLAGVAAAYLRQPPAIELAVHLDRSLKLKDRIGTATAIDAHQSGLPAATIDPEFAEYVRHEAARLAGRVDIPAATPIRITGIWFAAISLAATLWLGERFVPALAHSGPRAPAAPPELKAAQAQQFSQTINDAVEAIPQDADLDPASAEDVAALNRLAEQLNNPEQADEALAAREESAARMNELADRLAEQARREQAAAEELTRRFERVKTADELRKPLASPEIMDAMERGDFEQAAQKLDEMLNPGDQSTLAQRRATAEQLRELARQLEKASQTSPDEITERAEQLKQALRDQGLDEQTTQRLIDEPPSSQEIERELREQNLDPQTARDIAQDIQELDEDRQTNEQADRDSQALADSLDRAAEQLENPAPPQFPPQSRTQSRTQSEPATQPQAATQPKTDADRQPPQTNQREQDPTQQDPQQQDPQQQDRQPQDSQQEDSQRQQQQRGDEQQTTQDSGSQSESRQQRDQSATQPGQRESQGDRQQQPPDQAQQPTTQPGAQQQQQSGDQPDQSQPSGQPQQDSTQSTQSQTQPAADQRQGQPQQSQTQPSAQQSQQQHSQQQQQQHRRQQTGEGDPNQPPETPQSPSETIRKLAERFQKGQDQQKSAERLRDLARELMENTTPEERQRWMEQWQRQNQQQQQQPQQPEGEMTPEQLQELREAGEEMLERMSPEERQRMMEQMQQLQERQPHQPRREQVPPGDSQDAPNDQTPRGDRQSSRSSGREAGADPTGKADQPQRRAPQPLEEITKQDIDLRGRERGQQLITEWLNQDGATPEGTAKSGDSSPQVRQAQAIAERAVNDSAVQKRYHKMIKRYFGRLNQTIEKAANPPASTSDPAPSAPPSNDAPSPSGN